MTTFGKPPNVRARILALVLSQPQGLVTSEVCRQLDLPSKKVSTHLSKLAAYGAIRFTKDRNDRSHNKATWRPPATLSDD